MMASSGSKLHSQVLELKAIEFVLSRIAGYIYDQIQLPEKIYEIDGAPSWYLQNDDKEWYCAFSFATGDFGAINQAEARAEFDLIEKQNRILADVLGRNLERYRILSDLEENFVSEVRTDRSTERFIRSNSEILKVKYDENVEPATAFARSCVRRDQLWGHYKDKIARIARNLNITKSNELFEKFNVINSESKKVFNFDSKINNHLDGKEANQADTQLKFAEKFWEATRD